MQIGPFVIEPALALAPMAGVTDRPFRALCRRFGAGLTVSEMTTADERLWNTNKSRTRMDHAGEPGPVAIQIAGGDPATLARAARRNVEHGAQIVDINMGCPAKKVCKADAGSALMRDEALVARICSAVVAAVPDEVPVTLKIRTGWARDQRNGVAVARIAQDCGIRAIAVHGRTREDLFAGNAEYETIAAIKQAVNIPVWANGDIDCALKAGAVLRRTGADGLMIGRAAQGRPWIFREIAYYLATGNELAPPTRQQCGDILIEHIAALHGFYGEVAGVRVARKHIRWYCLEHAGSESFWRSISGVDSAALQCDLVKAYFSRPDVLQVAA